jgi:lipopolysaccharide biosynthesis regulator YciM
MYASFIFVSLEEELISEVVENGHYKECMILLREFFLKINEKELSPSPSIVLSKVRLFKEKNQLEDAYEVLKNSLSKNNSQVMKIEYIKLLVDLGKNEEFIEEAKILLEDLQQSLTRHFCQRCGYNSDDIFWRCPQCHEWETIQFRWKV